MCQSKAEGGIRCSSYAIEALQKHHDKQIEMVKEYAKENGIKLPKEESLYNDFEHRVPVFNKVNEVPAYKKAEKEFYRDAEAAQKAKFDLASVAQHRNVSSIAGFLWKRDAEVTATLALRDKAWEDNDDTAADMYIAKLQSMRAKTTQEAENIVKIVNEHGTYQLANVLNEQGTSPKYLSDIYKSHQASKENFSKVRKEVVAKEKQRFISKEFRKTAEYKAVANSTGFRKQPEVRKWEEKAQELQTEYSMTSDYRQKLEDLASFHPVGSEERERIEAQIRKVDTRKKMTILKNQREAAEASGSKETVNA